MSLVNHVFEGQQIRVQLDDSGEPWFVANDVAAALGYGNTRSTVGAHVRPKDSQKLGTPTQGGVQQLVHINERGLYRLVMRSNAQNAERFQDWVTDDVLPSIRKTGSYAVANAAPKQLSARAQAYEYVEGLLARVGVHQGIAAARMLEIVEADTGIPLEAARKALPVVAEDLGGMTPTQLAERIGSSAAKTNKLLCELGLQERDAKQWMLTESGKAHADAFPYSRNGHTGVQIKWRESVLGLIAKAGAQ